MHVCCVCMYVCMYTHISLHTHARAHTQNLFHGRSGGKSLGKIRQKNANHKNKWVAGAFRDNESNDHGLWYGIDQNS